MREHERDPRIKQRPSRSRAELTLSVGAFELFICTFIASSTGILISKVVFQDCYFVIIMSKWSNAMQHLPYRWSVCAPPLQWYDNKLTFSPQNDFYSLSSLPDTCTFSTSNLSPSPLTLCLCRILRNVLFFWFKLLYFQCSFSSAFSLSLHPFHFTLLHRLSFLLPQTPFLLSTCPFVSTSPSLCSTEAQRERNECSLHIKVHIWKQIFASTQCSSLVLPLVNHSVGTYFLEYNHPRSAWRWTLRAENHTLKGPCYAFAVVPFL